jgi:hypothetical protein
MNIQKLKEYFDKTIYSFSKCTIQISLSTEFQRFKNLTNTIDELYTHQKQIERTCSLIEEVVSKYENGYIFKSFDKMIELMTLLSENLNSIIVKGKTATDFLNTNFYRMRMSESLLEDKKEIFHIPKSLRTKISSQRYSIPGLPCLYLSSSAYTCWTEMGKPQIQDLHISRFILNDGANVDILNFSMVDPKRLFYKDKKHEFQGDDKYYIERLELETQINAFIIWPLLFACSLFGSYKNDPYKPEYIVPQFLLQWIRHKVILNGIAYLSIDTNPQNIDPFLCINYVFPVHDMDPEICKYLSQIFKISKPKRCDFILNIFSGYSGISPQLSHRRFQHEDYEGEGRINYEYTNWGMIEQYLNDCIVSRIGE